MKSNLNILLTGTHCSANKGDATMQLTMLDQLQTLSSHYFVTISAPHPKLDRPFYSPTLVTPCYRRRLILSTTLLLRAVLWRWLKTHMGWDVRLLIANAELRTYHNSHLIIDLSGDMLTEDYGPHIAYSHFLPILLALAMGKPVLCIAQSIGPFKHFRSLARFLLYSAKRVTVRDPITMDYLLREELLTPDKMTLTADLAFLLKAAPDERLTEILSLNNPPITDTSDTTPWLGIAVSPLIESHYRRRNPGGKQQEFTALIAKIADQCHTEFGTQALFIPHVTGPKPSADDRAIARRVVAHMRSPYHLITGDHRPDELKALISRCKVVLGARMHANMAAASSMVPVVSISYSHKTEGIMQLLGMSELVLPVGSLNVTGTMNLLRHVFSKHEKYVEHLHKVMPEITRKSALNIDVVANFIQQELDTHT